MTETGENLYEKYKDVCGTCGHWRIHHNHGSIFGFSIGDSGCPCLKYIQMTPMQICEKIEESYKNKGE